MVRNLGERSNTYQVVETQWEILLKPNLNRFTKGGAKAALEQGDKTSEEEYRIYFLSRVDDFVDKIHLFVEALETEAEKKIELIRVIQVYVLALTLIVIIFNMQFIRKGVMQPLNELMKSAGAIKKGNFSVRVKINTEDELGQLGTAFNCTSSKHMDCWQPEVKRWFSSSDWVNYSGYRNTSFVASTSYFL
jgi:two-component system nitrate/nitrite sensor histidine kinase NarX